MASMNGLTGPNTGAARSGTFRAGGSAERQRLPHRPPVHPMPEGQLTDRHVGILPTVPTDRFEHSDTLCVNLR